MFASVGADGSVRMFDLRHLEHSTIIYEDPQHHPLLRLCWNKQDPNYLATMAMDGMEVRTPLEAHQGPAHSALVLLSGSRRAVLSWWQFFPQRVFGSTWRRFGLSQLRRGWGVQEGLCSQFLGAGGLRCCLLHMLWCPGPLHATHSTALAHPSVSRVETEET